MRLASFVHAGRERAGVVVDDQVHPFPEPTTVLDLVRGGLPQALTAGRRAAAGAPVPLADVRLLPPLRPPSIRDFVAFEEHVEGMAAGMMPGAPVPPEWYEAPTFYFTNPHALLATGDDVPVPPGCQALDYEHEVAAVVGRRGGNLSPAQARDHIFGYTVFNDWSARDLQQREMRMLLGPAKGKDFASTLGPWLVTADELEPHRDAEGFLRLLMTAEVNGVETGRDLLSNMGWPFEDLVAYAARGTEIHPGDVLGSGTCGNGGCLAELWGRRGRPEPPPLRPGDTVTLTVQGIGTVTNRVVPGPSPEPIPAARPRPRDRS
jgi:2-keto-4-pentenoate hydratase/2-oxohepta-3-ene-1,7-dioic acid hydratase in catechol pathway